MAKSPKPLASKEHRTFGVKLIRLEREAYELGLPCTARQINAAIRELGWDMEAALKKKQRTSKGRENG